MIRAALLSLAMVVAHSHHQNLQSQHHPAKSLLRVRELFCVMLALLKTLEWATAGVFQAGLLRWENVSVLQHQYKGVFDLCEDLTDRADLSLSLEWTHSRYPRSFCSCFLCSGV